MIGSKVTAAGGGGFSAEITVEGLEGTLAAMRAFEPKLLTAMNREIRAIVKEVAAHAASRLPRSALNETPYAVRTSTRGRRPGMKAVAIGKNAAIFEFAGKRGVITCPQGAAMIDWLSTQYGSPGRFLWDAWDTGAARNIPRIAAAIKAAEVKLQTELDRQGVGY